MVYYGDGKTLRVRKEREVKFGKLLTAGILAFAMTLVMLPAPTAEAAGCRDSMYRSGSRSTCVRYIQTMLNAMQSKAGRWAGNGYSGGYIIAVDGVFGYHTATNVKVMQRWFNSWHSYQTAVDGIVGPDTWSFFKSYAYKNGISTYWGYRADAIPASALGF